jgi:N-acetylneuraminate synthase
MENKFKLNNGTIIQDFGDPYFIAEINSSHFGDIELAKKMILNAKASGIQCVKFQSWSPETLYSQTFYDENPIAKRFVNKFSLSQSDLEELFNFSKKNNIDFSSTPYSEQEVIFLLEKCKAPFIKIASMEINNHSFLEFIARTGSAIILSTGMSTFDEIESAVEVIKQSGNSNLCVLHCVSVYPCEPEKVNLNNIQSLREILKVIPIGYSDHTLGPEAAFAATAIGAPIIEKHFTLDSSKIGMDNQMASEPYVFKEMINTCKIIQSALGSTQRTLDQEELDQRENMRRSIVSSKFIPAGKKITADDLIFKRPGNGFKPTDLSKVIGSKSLRDIDQDQVIYQSDISQ